MRFWNLSDDGLIRTLRAEFSASMPKIGFAPGVEGGVAVYLDGELAGIWVELRRGRFTFFSTLDQRALAMDCPQDSVAASTGEILASLDLWIAAQSPHRAAVA